MLLIEHRFPFVQKTLLFFVFLIFTNLSAYSQQGNTDRWIQESSVSFQPGSERPTYIRGLTRDLKDNQVLGLGEATSGTHEFFREKVTLIKHLVAKQNYRLLGFEISERAMSRINEYIQGKSAELVLLMNSLRLHNSEELYSLFEWLRNFNQRQKPTEQVTVFGLVHSMLTDAPDSRNKAMFEKIKATRDSLGTAKTILWAHNTQIRKTPGPEKCRGIGYYLNNNYGNSYYALGMDSFEGSVYTIGRSSYETNEFQMGETSLSAQLARTGQSGLFLPLTTAPDEKMTILNIGSAWTGQTSTEINGRQDMDALLFIRNTSLSKMMGGNPVN